MHSLALHSILYYTIYCISGTSQLNFPLIISRDLHLTAQLSTSPQDDFRISPHDYYTIAHT